MSNKKLKTLKDILEKKPWLTTCGVDIITKEAKEWIEYIRDDESEYWLERGSVIEWIKHFFNLGDK